MGVGGPAHSGPPRPLPSLPRGHFHLAPEGSCGGEEVVAVVVEVVVVAVEVLVVAVEVLVVAVEVIVAKNKPASNLFT